MTTYFFGWLFMLRQSCCITRLHYNALTFSFFVLYYKVCVRQPYQVPVLVHGEAVVGGRGGLHRGRVLLLLDDVLGHDGAVSGRAAFVRHLSSPPEVTCASSPLLCHQRRIGWVTRIPRYTLSAKVRSGVRAEPMSQLFPTNGSATMNISKGRISTVRKACRSSGGSI